MTIISNKTAFKWGELVVSIFRLNSLLVAVGNEIARPVGQTSARWSVLASAYSQSQTVSQIARRMGLTRQSVQRTVDLLVEEGFATLEDNNQHKRAKLIKLTNRGRKAMEAIAEEQQNWANRWSKKLNERDLTLTLENLRRIEDICRNDQENRGIE